MCLFCQQNKCKEEHEKLLVSWERHQQVHETLTKAADIRNDITIKRHILGEYLVACEARYHAECYNRFTSVLKNKYVATLLPQMNITKPSFHQTLYRGLLCSQQLIIRTIKLTL